MKLVLQLVVAALVMWLSFAAVKAALRPHPAAQAQVRAESGVEIRATDLSTEAGRKNVIDGIQADVQKVQDEAKRGRERADTP